MKSRRLVARHPKLEGVSPSSIPSLEYSSKERFSGY
jgi:hypothetical protein